MALDGSETSDYALNVAVKIGEVETSTIDLLHVTGARSQVVSATPVFDPILGSSAVMIPARAQTGADTERGKKSLLDDRRELVLVQNLQCNTVLIESDDVSGEILKLASSGNYDLAVLGSRGLGGIKGFLLGSISQKVAKESKIPVLIVKQRVEGIPKILLGYDGSDEGKKALDFAISLGKKFKAQVRVATIVSVPISPDAYVVTDIDRWEKEATVQNNNAVSALKAEGINADGKVLDYADISRGLSEQVEKGSFDFLIVGSKGRGRLKSFLLGSVASGVANSAKTNVLIAR